MFPGVRKSGLHDCSIREKGSVWQNITGAWGKNVSKKIQSQKGEGTFS